MGSASLPHARPQKISRKESGESGEWGLVGESNVNVDELVGLRKSFATGLLIGTNDMPWVDSLDKHGKSLFRGS